MWLNYFEYKGKKYYTGTVIILKDGLYEKEASFIGHEPDKDWYAYRVNDITRETTHRTYEKLFYKNLIAVTNKIDKNVHLPLMKQLPDRCIDGLLLGWTWYIFLMMIATIFKGNVVLWIFISYVFFDWRKNKIKKEGTYIEW